MSSSNEKPLKTDDEYDSALLFKVHERGMTLDINQFMKKPGIKEDFEALMDIRRVIRKNGNGQRGDRGDKE